jgi:ABC-type amino acid transport system permease subunit
VSVIAIVELTQQYQILARSSLQFVEIGALTAALYPRDVGAARAFGPVSRRALERGAQMSD